MTIYCSSWVDGHRHLDRGLWIYQFNLTVIWRFIVSTVDSAFEINGRWCVSANRENSKSNMVICALPYVERSCFRRELTGGSR